MSASTPPTVRNLQDVIDAVETVDWSAIEEVSTADVAKWTQKLEYARKVAERDFEE